MLFQHEMMWSRMSWKMQRPWQSYQSSTKQSARNSITYDMSNVGKAFWCIQNNKMRSQSGL